MVLLNGQWITLDVTQPPWTGRINVKVLCFICSKERIIIKESSWALSMRDHCRIICCRYCYLGVVCLRDNSAQTAGISRQDIQSLNEWKKTSNLNAQGLTVCLQTKPHWTYCRLRFPSSWLWFDHADYLGLSARCCISTHPHCWCGLNISWCVNWPVKAGVCVHLKLASLNIKAKSDRPSHCVYIQWQFEVRLLNLG